MGSLRRPYAGGRRGRHGGGTGARLYALDAATGATDWSTDLGVPGSSGISYRASIAYDAGRVFAVNATDDRLRTFDAATGALLWTSPPPLDHSSPASAPTAVTGVVYYQSGYTLRHRSSGWSHRHPLLYSQTIASPLPARPVRP